MPSSITSLLVGLNQSQPRLNQSQPRLERTVSALTRDSIQSFEEEQDDSLPPTEEPDPVLADRRHPPTIQDEVMTLLLNSMLQTVIESWEGVPAMRPILKPASAASPPVDETLVLDEQLDLVPDTIHSPTSIRRRKSRSDTRHRRTKETSLSVTGSKNKKKPSKNSVDRSVASVMDAEAASSKHPRSSIDKKKRRPSKEKKGIRRISEDESNLDDKQSTATGEESGGEMPDIKDETKAGLSVPEIVGRTPASCVDLSSPPIQPEEVRPPSIESWRVHFPDEIANVILKNGSHYEGRISRKLMEGTGKFTWADGTRYRGEFVSGEMTGRGNLTWPDMSRYTGDLVKGWRYGRGLFVASYEKLAYVGDWVEGRKHGSGLVFYNELGTDTYDGEWCNDQREGYGLRVYPSGARYLGDWRQGLRHGEGTMFFANGDVYSGNWEEGFMNGYGEYIWGAFLNDSLVNFGDNVYSGWFSNGRREGEATYQLEGGQYIHGEWHTDVKCGRARVVCGDGSVYVGKHMFEDDRPAARAFEPAPGSTSIRKRSSIKDVPQKVQYPKTKKVEMSSVHHLQKKISTDQKSMSFHRTKPPPPNPTWILHGHYLPVYSPFQSIDFRHHLALLKALKHPTESTGSQTDDSSLGASSSIRYGHVSSTEERSESKKGLEGVKDTDSNLQFNFKYHPNEQSTQTQDDWIDVHCVPTNEEEISTLRKDISKKASNCKSVMKRTKHAKESSHSSSRLLANGAKNRKKTSLGTIPSKAKLHRRKPSFGTQKGPTRWPFNAKVAYPCGLSEEAYEETWLRRTLTLHLPAIRRAYNEYARLAWDGRGEVSLQPFMLRAMMWQFYRDCKITTRMSLVELDRMLAMNPLTRVASFHCPFERIKIWQFLYSLVDVAWKLYASKGLGHPGAKGVLGSAFDKLMRDDVLPRPAAGSAGSVFTRHRDLLPLAPVYQLYQSLGEPLSARRLLRETCCRTGAEPELPRPRAVAHYPDFAANGVNAFVLAGDLTFLPRKPPLSCVERASYEVTTSTSLVVFREVGVDGLVNVLVDICPGIKEDGVIVNMDYELTFLEFYEVLIKCEERSHVCEERRLARLAALEKYRLEVEATTRSNELEKPESITIALATKAGRTKQKKGSKFKP